VSSDSQHSLLSIPLLGLSMLCSWKSDTLLTRSLFRGFGHQKRPCGELAISTWDAVHPVMHDWSLSAFPNNLEFPVRAYPKPQSFRQQDSKGALEPRISSKVLKKLSDSSTAGKYAMRDNEVIKKFWKERRKVETHRDGKVVHSSKLEPRAEGRNRRARDDPAQKKSPGFTSPFTMGRAAVPPPLKPRR
jgi:hypothetical protein